MPRFFVRSVVVVFQYQRSLIRGGFGSMVHHHPGKLADQCFEQLGARAADPSWLPAATSAWHFEIPQVDGVAPKARVRCRVVGRIGFKDQRLAARSGSDVAVT